MYKKALTTFFLFLFLSIGALSFFPTPTHAQINPYYQGPWYLQGPVQWYTKVYDSSNPQEIFGERYTAAQVQWVVYSLFSVAVNTVVPPEAVICAATFDIAGACTEGAYEFLRRMFANPSTNSSATSNLPNEQTVAQKPSFVQFMLADRPLSGIGYVRGIATNLHIIPEAHAQTAQSGFGYGAFTFIQGLWQGARNITYGLMVLIIVAMAFMIMFRVKLSPQTVITVQSALPKLIITLILVTFSYAIAGFMVDIMYVVIGLLSLVFTQSEIFTTTAAEMFRQMTAGNMDLGILGVFILYWVRFILAAQMIILTPSGIFSGIVIMPIIATLAVLIMTIMVIFISFKTLIMLIKTFINIILLVIAAPFMISFGALSAGGGSLGFGGWFRALAAQVFVYPLVATLMNVSFIFMAAAYGIGGSSLIPTSWVGNGAVGNWMFGVNSTLFRDTLPWSPPLTLGSNVAGLRLMFLFASLGVIGIIPKTAELIQSLIAKKPFSYGSAIGEAFGPISGGVGYATGMGKAGTTGGVASGVQYGLGALKAGTFHPRTLGKEILGGAGAAIRKRSGL